MRVIDDVKRDIDNNFTAYNELKENTHHFQGEERLYFIKMLGAFCADYMTGEFSSNELEQLLAKEGSGIPFAHTKDRDASKILIVMTAASDIGGHTALVNNLIKADVYHSYSLVITDYKSKGNTPTDLLNGIQDSGGQVYFLSNESFKSDINDLLQLSDGFSHIVLFTHMYDVLPVLAYSNESFKTPVLFYHHADHRFAFGFSVSDRVLFLRDYDKQRGTNRNGIDSSICKKLRIYGGGIDVQTFSNRLSEKERSDVRSSYQIGVNDKLVVSMGYEERYEPIVGYSFFDYMNRMLERCDDSLKFLIIGPSPDSGKWKNAMRLSNGQITAVGIKQKDEAMRIIGAADLFIVSFPMPSAGAIPAHRMGVKVRALSLTGVTRESLGDNALDSIEDLVNESVRVLYDLDDHSQDDTLNAISEQDFLRDWGNILKTTTEHRPHPFSPERRVEQYEVVYWQSLKETVGNSLYSVMEEINEKFDGTDKISELLYDVDERYRLGFKAAYQIRNLRKELSVSRKYRLLFEMASKWLIIRQHAMMIADYFEAKGWVELAVYGMGPMGRLLIEELKDSRITVCYGIDKRAAEMGSEIDIYSPCDRLDRVDVIINTTLTDNNLVLKSMPHGSKYNIVSLREIIDNMY